jgi:lysophospholipase L1-like esterase
MTSPYVKLRRKAAYVVLSRRFANDPIADGDIVFFGDSITAQGSWAEWFPNQPVKVRGIGGDTTTGLLRRTHQVLGRPSKLFLMIGTNDVADGRPVDAIAATTKQVVDTITGTSPDTRLYLQSVTPRTTAMAPAIRAVNQALQNLAAATPNATYVELFDLLSAPDGALVPGYSVDDLHLQPPAYDIWRDAVRPFVEG